MSGKRKTWFRAHGYRGVMDCQMQYLWRASFFQGPLGEIEGNKRKKKKKEKKKKTKKKGGGITF